MNQSQFNQETANLIIGYVKFDSSFTNSLCERILFNDDLVIFCIELIETSRKMETLEDQLFSSAILALLLRLLKSNGQYNTAARTELVDKLFTIRGQIEGLCVVDIFGGDGIKPTFDFRNKQLLNCTFDNYEYFWECAMNENTRFESSFFRNIDPRAGIRPESVI